MTDEESWATVACAESSVRTIARRATPEASSWGDARSAILKAADALRGLGGQDRLPVQLAGVAKLRGITGVRRGSFDVMGGALAPKQGGFVVLLPSDAPRVRQRAILAHEIAHTFFYDLESPSPTRLLRAQAPSAKRKHKEEDICQAFAAELLMPKDLVRPLTVQPAVARLQLARGIASRCDVSLEFAIVRLLHTFPEFAECVAVVAAPDDHLVHRVSRYWGVGWSKSRPASILRLSTQIKDAFLAADKLTDPVVAIALDTADQTSQKLGVQFGWLEWGGPWGGSIVAFIEGSRPSGV